MNALSVIYFKMWTGLARPGLLVFGLIFQFVAVIVLIPSFGIELNPAHVAKRPSLMWKNPSYRLNGLENTDKFFPTSYFYTAARGR